jgi:ubiquinone/menaquinone biosynthesis C-methylase UbiE
MATREHSTMAEPASVVPENYRKGARLSLHQKRRHRAVLSLLKGVSGRVLDYGCGYGDLTHAISRTHEVVGCDVDPNRVAFAQREYAAIEYRVCGADCVPYADHSFEIIVSAVVIHFVPDPDAYLQEVKRVLRPGGHLLIVCRNQAVVRNGIRRMLGKGPEPSTLWLPSQVEMKEFLAARGFEFHDSTYFYDPPFNGWKNPGDWVIGSIEQLFSMFGIQAPAGYHAYLTRYTKR